jgi:hypothetical protein
MLTLYNKLYLLISNKLKYKYNKENNYYKLTKQGNATSVGQNQLPKVRGQPGQFTDGGSGV